MELEEIGFDISLGRLSALCSRRQGAAKVIALHGWLDNAASFVPLARAMPALDFVALDLPGHGQSVHLPKGCEYGHSVWINAVFEVADILGWSRFALLGHSMGAAAATLMAAALPERIERLCLIDALGTIPEKPGSTASLLRERFVAADALSKKSICAFPDMSAAVRSRRKINQLSEMNAELLVRRGVKPVDGGLYWSTDPRLTLPDLRLMTESQIRNIIQHVTCPVKVIYSASLGDETIDELIRERVSYLRDGTFHVIESVHHVHMEMPDAVVEVIGTFFTV